MKDRAGPDGSTGGCCGVNEGQFPCLGICCEARKGTFGTEYRSVCLCCSAMTLPPDSSTLQIATFFECFRFGFSRRMTDAKPPEQTKCTGNKQGGSE